MVYHVSVDQCDPYGYVAGQHFNQLLSRYGAPIILLNLVKVSAEKFLISSLWKMIIVVYQ